MKKEIADQWVAALRSGKYKQGRGALRTHDPEGDKFCCLGVLCDVLGLKWGEADESGNFECDDRRGALPDKAKELSGVQSAQGKLRTPYLSFCSLVQCNDNGMTFNQIADLIEKHWKAL